MAGVYSQLSTINKLHDAERKQQAELNQQIKEEQRLKEERENANFFERLGFTVADIFTELGGGLAKLVEGVVDAGVSIAGGIGGLFGADTKWAEDFVKFDATQEWWYSWEDDITNKSFLNDGGVGNTTKEIIRGVGQQLPTIAAIALAPVTGGASLGALPYTLGATIASAGGTGVEEALNEDANFGEAFLYGTLQAGIEGLVEFASAGMGKGITSIGKAMGKTATKTMGKVMLEEALSEAFEEGVGALVNPLTKRIYDENALEAYKDLSFYQSAAEQALVGGIVGGITAGTGAIVRTNIAGGKANLNINESINEIEVLKRKEANLWKNGKLNADVIENIDQQRRAEIENISNQLKAMNEADRKAAIEKYKLQEYVNDNGEIKANLSKAQQQNINTTNVQNITQNANGEQLANNQQNVARKPLISDNIEAYSPSLRNTELVFAPTQNKLSEAAQSAKKFVTSLNPNAKLVITDNMFENVNAFYDTQNKILYLSNEATTQEIAGHEFTHSLEGTKEYSSLANYILENTENVDQKIQEKIKQYQEVNKEAKSGEVGKEVALYEAQTEIVAEEMGRLLSDPKAIDRIINQNKSVANRIWQWIKDVVAKLTKRGGDKTYYNYIRNAEKLYAAAIKNSVGGIGLSEVAAIAEFEKQAKEAEALANKLEKRYNINKGKRTVKYVSYDKVGIDNVKHIRSEVSKLYSNVKDGIADGIAIEKGNNVYVVDTGKDDGNISFGIRKVLEISDENLRKAYVKELNNDAISKGHVSDEVSSKLGNEYDNSGRSNRGQELGKELSNNPTKSSDNKSEVSRNDGTRGRKGLRYSLNNVDNNGNNLTEKQLEFFANSKAVDNKGNLKVLYHGTPTGGFTEFTRNFNYFTDSKDVAGTYTSKSENIYQVYLNLENPIEIDAHGEKWSMIAVDKITINGIDDVKGFLRKYGASTYYEKGALRTSTSDIVSAIKEAIDEEFFDADGVIINNIIDEGMFGGDKNTVANDYVAFHANQIKNTDNKNPSKSSKDIRYSLKNDDFNNLLKDVVENDPETKNLVVVHNTTADKLLKSIKLGGLAVPSIAVIKSNNGFNNFGDISLIFKKDTIDPKNNKNKVYSSDVYSKRFPKTIDKFSKEVVDDLRSKFSKSAEIFDTDLSNLETLIENNTISNIASNLAYKDYVQVQYLKDNGIKFDPEYKNFELKEIEKDVCEHLIALFPEEVKYRGLRQSDFLIKNVVPEIKKIKKDYYTKVGWLSLVKSVEEKTGLGDADRYLDMAKEYQEKKGTKVLDEKATHDKLKELINDKRSDIEKYVADILNQYYEDSYFRNNKDYYDAAGYPRNFNQLYNKLTLENVLNYMKGEVQNTEGFNFGVGNLRSLLAQQFESIEDIKNNKDKIISTEEMEKLKEISQNAYYELATEIHEDVDAGGEMLNEIAKTNRSEQSIKRVFKENYYDAPSDELIKNIQDFLDQLEEYPTEYFEAKPQRNVDFDEVVAVIAPNNVNKEIVDFFKNKNIDIKLYNGSEEARSKFIQDLPEDIRFSLKDGNGDYNYSKGQISKYVAEHSKMKAYTKADAEKVINTVVSEHLNFGNKYGELTGKTKDEIVSKMWHALNTVNEGYRLGVALDIADYIIENAVVQDMYGDDALQSYFDYIDAVKSYLHNVDLDSLKGEIKYHYDTDNSPYAIWGKRKGTRGSSPDQIAQELEEYGVHFNSNVSADIFFEMDERYREAVRKIKAKTKEKIADIASPEEIKELRNNIAREVSLGYDNTGHKTKLAETIEKYTKQISSLKKAVRDIKQHNKAKNNAISTIERLKDEFVKSKPAGWKVPQQVVDFVKKISKVETWRNNISQTARQYLGELQTQLPNILDETQQEIYPYKEILSEIAAGKGELTTDELVLLDNVLRQFAWQLRNYDKVVFEGKSQSNTDLAAQAVRESQEAKDILKNSNNIFIKFKNKVYTNPYDRLAAFGLYRKDSIAMKMYQDMLEGDRRRANFVKDAAELFDPFFDKNKKYLSELQKDITLGDGENKVTMTKRQALALYATSLREQGRSHIFNVSSDEGVIRLLDNKFSTQGKMQDAFAKGRDVRITAEMIEEIKNKLTDADKEYLEITKKFFNEKSKDAKKVTDQQLYGITNIENGYYFPLRVSNDKIYTEAGQNNNKATQYILDLGINKSTKPNASNKIVIDGIDNIIANHIRTMSMYYGYAIPLTAYNRIMNKQVLATEGVDTTSNMRSEIQKIDTDFEGYMNKLWQDVQGISRGDKGFVSNVLSKIRWAGANAALGANPKVLVTQTLSLSAGMAEFNPKYIAKGMAHFFGEAEKVEMAKYSSLMWERNVAGISTDVSEIRQIGKEIGNKFGKAAAKATQVLNDFTTKPISWMDSNVIQTLWFAAQYEVADTMGKGYEFGTEANKVEAGKRLDEVVFRTQQTSDPLGRSEWMRSQNEIVKFARMFTGDAVQLTGRLINSINQYNIAKRMIKSSNTSISEQGKTLLKTAKTNAWKAGAAFATNQLFLLAIAMAFKWIKGKNDDEEWDDIAKNEAIANMVGLIPFGGDIYEKLQGYEPTNMAYTALSDTVEIAENLYSGLSTLITNDYQDPVKRNAAIRKTALSMSKLFGVPTQNIESYMKGIIGKISPSTREEYEALFKTKSNKAYLEKIKQATANGDEKLANTIVNIMFNSKTGKIKDDKVLEITRDLIEDGYDVLPKSVGNSITYDNETYKLTGRQHDKFMKIYSQSTDKIKTMINSYSFKLLSNEAKAKAMKFVYDYYYDLAIEDLLGEDIEEKNLLFAEAIPIEQLAMAVCQSRLYASDTDRKGNVINGSKKAKVQAFIQGLRLTAVQKYMIMGYLGYTNKYGERQVKGYINGLKLSKSEKQKLYSWSGYSQ